MEALDECDDELVAELEKYPHLNKYFRFFMENPDDTEDPGFLSRLIGWIRAHVAAYVQKCNKNAEEPVFYRETPVKDVTRMVLDAEKRLEQRQMETT